MRIGEVAAATGVSTKTIRYYESLGVLPSARRAGNGYRVYDHAVVDRLGFVKDAQAAGLSLSEIELILQLRDEGRQTCHHVTALLHHHLDEVDQQLEELTRTRRRLEEIIDRAESMDPLTCTDPNSCQTLAGTARRKASN